MRLHFERILGPRTALDLAIFRILVVLGWLATVNPRLAAHFALYPPELSFPPSAWRHIIDALPVNAAAVWICYAIFLLAALAALIGLRARLALIAMLISGGYVLSIPQFFGKVNHTNHLVWFALLLAASPCAHALALDARRERHAREPHAAYALPLGFAAILTAIAYFFPGFWKLASVGWDWASPDNMVNLLRSKWTEFGDWKPWPRIDRWPWLCALGGAITIAFELLFLPLALWRRTRPAALSTGLAFHAFTWWFMGIHLWHLAIGYAAFVPWHALTHARKTGLPQSPRERGEGEKRADEDGDARRGRGRERAAISRLCPARAVGRTPWMCFAPGCLLVIGNLHNGIFQRDWWPLGCYPTFAHRHGPQVASLVIRADFSDGSQRVLTEAMLGAHSASERARGLCARIMTSADRDEKLIALWELWKKLEPGLENAQRVNFVWVVVSTSPERQGQVIAERIIHELSL